MSERIEPCPKERVPELIALLDEEFVLSRGRAISVERRFPEVFFARNLGNLWTVLVDGEVVAAAVAKPFEWLADEKTWTAAMVGLVVTRPELRGRGLASRLLVRLQSHLAQQGSELAVLWTRHPQFYERLGWIQGDEGLFGRALLDAEESPLALALGGHPPGEKEVAEVERLRSQWAKERAQRSRATYHALPMPATSLEIHLAPRGEEPRAFAVVGKDGNTGYVYEWLGDPKAFPALWSSVRANCCPLFFNDRAGSSASVWLARECGVTWTEQRLAMWLPLAPSTCAPALIRWVIPYLDRI